jgi:hypothetical protein
MIILPFYAIFQIISFMMNRWQKQLKGAALWNLFGNQNAF